MGEIPFDPTIFDTMAWDDDDPEAAPAPGDPWWLPWPERDLPPSGDRVLAGVTREQFRRLRSGRSAVDTRMALDCVGELYDHRHAVERLARQTAWAAHKQAVAAWWDAVAPGVSRNVDRGLSWDYDPACPIPEPDASALVRHRRAAEKAIADRRAPVDPVSYLEALCVPGVRAVAILGGTSPNVAERRELTRIARLYDAQAEPRRIPRSERRIPICANPNTCRNLCEPKGSGRWRSRCSACRKHLQRTGFERIPR